MHMALPIFCFQACLCQHIAAGHGCAQIIWLKHQLIDFGVKSEKVILQVQST